MMCPQDTRIAYVGGSNNIAVLEAIMHLVNADFNVVACPLNHREGEMLLDAGIFCSLNREDVVAGCDVVLTSSNQPAELEKLYLGENGLLELLDPGTIAIDLSFTPPRLAREIQAMASVADITFVDAPLVNVGEGEDSVCFVGGEPDAAEAIGPLLPYLASTIYPQAGPGEGQMAAVIAYIGLAGSIMGTIEALSLARIAGFDNKGALNVLASTTAASRALVEYSPRMMSYDYDGRIRVAELMDALDVVLDTAEDLDVTAPLAETAYQLYDLLCVVGGETMNIQALALLYEDERTCADFGLDWALADQARAAQAPSPAEFREMIERAIEDGDIAPGEAPDEGFSSPGMGWPMLGGPSGLGNGTGSRPSAGSFFSKN